MVDIDEIMNLLYWDNSKEIVEKGIELGKNIEHLDAFILPYYKKGSKGVWEGCAKILCSKTEEELKPYIRKVLEIIQDLNWPGSILIYNRLVDFRSTWFDNELDFMINYTSKIGNEMWSFYLKKLKKRREENL